MRAIFGGPDRRRSPVTIEVRADGQPTTIDCVDGEVRVRPGSPATPDLLVSGPPNVILGILAGALEPADAAPLGVHIVGDPSLLRRLRPPDPRRSAPNS